MKIELKHIAKSFNGLPVLRDINLTFRDGEPLRFRQDHPAAHPHGTGTAG